MTKRATRSTHQLLTRLFSKSVIGHIKISIFLKVKQISRVEQTAKIVHAAVGFDHVVSLDFRGTANGILIILCKIRNVINQKSQSLIPMALEKE